MLDKVVDNGDDGGVVIVVERKLLLLLGCPLWSHVPEDAARAVAGSVSDFTKIDGWTVAKHNAAHAQDQEWLQQQVAAIQRKQPNIQVVVVTHHAPLVNKTAAPQHKDSPINSAFATDVCTDREGWESVKYCVFGHTHWIMLLQVKGIQVVTNQRGYVFPGFNVCLVREEHPLKHTFDAARTLRF